MTWWMESTGEQNEKQDVGTGWQRKGCEGRLWGQSKFSLRKNKFNMSEIHTDVQEVRQDN